MHDETASDDDRVDPTILCSQCEAVCCRLTVYVMADDPTPAYLVDQDEHGMDVMRRRDDGWCTALDRETMRCTIYACVRRSAGISTWAALIAAVCAKTTAGWPWPCLGAGPGSRTSSRRQGLPSSAFEGILVPGKRRLQTAAGRGTGRRWRFMGWRLVLYGAMLAAGTVALQWLDYQRLARSHWEDIYVLLVAAAFLALGMFVGARLFGRHRLAGRRQSKGPRRPRHQSSRTGSAQGTCRRPLNKEIARHLEVSPNTVKTHVTRLFEKLGARRRTEAIHRARELGIVS